MNVREPYKVFFEKAQRILTLIGLPLVLTACADSIDKLAEPPTLVDPPGPLVSTCETPVLLPERTLSQSEVERYWLRDRENLLQCGIQLDSLVEFYRKRDTELRK